MPDLRDALLGLVSPLAPGDDVVPGVRLVRASTEAGARLVFALEDEELDVEIAPAEPGAPSAATTAELRLTYAARGPLGRARGLSICRAVAERARDNEAKVLAALRSEAASDDPGSRIRRVRVTRLLDPVRVAGRTIHTLSPYVGCVIGCRFCYAQSHVAVARRFEGLPAVPWGSYVDVRVNAAEVLARELEELDVRIVKLCPIVSDPYQAVEERSGVTRACLEVLARAKRPPVTFVLTRSRLVERDADLLGAMRAWVGVSIPTIDDEVRAHFEPRAAPIADRLAALRTLRTAGAHTFAVVQPMLPGSANDLAATLADHCESVSLDVLQGVEGAAEDFADPRYREAASRAWQRAQARALEAALRARGVPVWEGELPPGV